MVVLKMYYKINIKPTYHKPWLQNALSASVARTANERDSRMSRCGNCGKQREQTEVQLGETARRNGAERKEATVKSHQTPSQMAEKISNGSKNCQTATDSGEIRR